MGDNGKQELWGAARLELEETLAGMGEARYRGRQLYHALYRERQWDLSRMTAFPGALRERLAQRCAITVPEIEKVFTSVDGAARCLMRLADGQQVEAVYLPEERRNTLCISTQVGCPIDCKFCLTGVMGFTRNLTAGEIVGQVLRLAARYGIAAEERLNLVFMGMGEPMLNYENTLAAVRLLADEQGAGISPLRMTLSTAGVVPGIEKLGRESIRPKLAISLNAATDELRGRIMPINRKWPLAELLCACREFPLRSREKLTFEYVLLEGVNDSPQDARRVAKLLEGLPCKVNLIGLNPGPELPFRTPGDERVAAFQSTLSGGGVDAFIRKPHGRDIFAACGQLKLAQQTTLSASM